MKTLLIAAALALAGCATAPSAPIVRCEADAAPPPLAPYPATGTDAQRAAWAVQAIAHDRINTILRQRTARCLVELQAKGIIEK